MHYNHALGIESSESALRPTLPRRRSADEVPAAVGIGALPVDAVVRAATAIAVWAQVAATESTATDRRTGEPAPPEPCRE